MNVPFLPTQISSLLCIHVFGVFKNARKRKRRNLDQTLFSARLIVSKLFKNYAKVIFDILLKFFFHFKKSYNWKLLHKNGPLPGSQLGGFPEIIGKKRLFFSGSVVAQNCKIVFYYQEILPVRKMFFGQNVMPAKEMATLLPTQISSLHVHFFLAFWKNTRKRKKKKLRLDTVQRETYSFKAI